MSNVVIGWVGLVSHHLRLPWGVIELTVLCTYACKVGYFDAQIMETLMYKLGGLISLPLWTTVTSYL